MHKNSYILLDILRTVISVLLLVTFWGLMAIDNPQLLRLNRTTVVMLVTYIVTTFAAEYIFGGYDFGRKKVRDIMVSLIMAQFMTDFITYMMMLFMNTNSFNDKVFRFSAKKLMLLCLVLHVLEIVIYAKLSGRLYSRSNTGEKCCVIASKDRDIGNIRSAMKMKNIAISKIIDHEDVADWQKEILKSDYTVVYDIPLDARARVMEYAYKYNKNIYFSPEICDILEKSSEQHMFEDSLMFFSPGFELSSGQKAAKRFMDIVLSLIMIIVSSPIWAICAIMIKADDHGKVFFKQERATIGGRPFGIIKFRTMRDSD